MIIGGPPNKRELVAHYIDTLVDAPSGDVELYRMHSKYLDKWATEYVRNFLFTLLGIKPRSHIYGAGVYKT